MILEITTPQQPPLSTFFRVWFDHVVPGLGRLAGDSDAYTYLPNSVKRFPGPEGLAARDGRGGPARHPLDPHGGRHHRHPRGNQGVTGDRARTVTEIVHVAGPHVGPLLARVEERLLEIAGDSGAGAVRARHGRR